MWAGCAPEACGLGGRVVRSAPSAGVISAELLPGATVWAARTSAELLAGATLHAAATWAELLPGVTLRAVGTSAEPFRRRTLCAAVTCGIAYWNP
ncbi:hypothetical protein GCM10010289_57630 [Streptomyces violascens]|uniref:Uncharacterized protein n=1 Tax=Streptomyces violascens TaxID=67381 RepID=A0ABQ3QVX5_9ACTN|nr:hypothetical protein GCM10010289_57630 [Streptomyces violascens]GHI41431.1 hypothetical protein Sviol_58390 [Streptomyces violascens]